MLARLRTTKLYLLTRDGYNKARYGRSAPVYSERIWIDPGTCAAVDLNVKRRLGWGRHASGRVVEDWPLRETDLIALTEAEKIKQCIRHWVEGAAWEHTGAYEFYEDRQFARDDLARRHRELDLIFEQVRRERRIKARNELDPKAFREEDGIRINVGPGGRLVFCDGGTHRLAMALIVDIPLIPAQVGCVYKGAIPLLEELRRPIRREARA